MMEVARYTSSGEAVKDDTGKLALAIPPSTPPRTQLVDLPTPPSSHIELSASTLPPPASHPQKVVRRMASTMQDRRSPSPVQTPSTTGIPAEHSPSLDAHRRKAKRMSGEGRNDEEEGGEEADEPRGRRRIETDSAAAGPSNSRSRTPSPILGSIVSQTGRLSFSAALQPSAEEIRTLLYGENNEDDREEARPRSVGQAEMDGLLQQLDAMGVAKADAATGEAQTSESREQKLASMVKRLVDHARKQDAYIDSMEASLHNTRLRSIATFSSVRTQFAHSFATEYELRARLQAELDGAKAQARKLSQLLAHSESRNEELDRERAMSAEEEVMWQEEMKDHASAYAQQRAARARAAHLAQQAQATPSTADGVKLERQAATSGADGILLDPQAEDGTDGVLPSSSPALPTSRGLEEPFEERKVAANGRIGALPQSHSEGSLAGLGITATGAVQIDGLAGSPLSTIIKERNKLLADKRYLRIRVRDSEAQRERLELELKSLRPLLVRGVPSKSTVVSQLTATPTTPGRSHKRDRSRRRRQAVMGDAEAEHLLLAARRLQTTRRALDEDGRPSTPPPASGASALKPRTPRTPKILQTPRSAIATDSVTMQSGASSSRDGDLGPAAAGTSLNASPLAGRNSGAALGRWGRHERIDSNRSAGGIDDLLHAAQSVLTPGERNRQQTNAGQAEAVLADSEEEEDVDETLREPIRSKDRSLFAASSVDESPKRRRVSSATPGRGRRESMLSMSPDKSIFVASRRMRTQTEGAEPPQHSSQDFIPAASQASALSALDLLADQAAASQVPSQSSEQSNSGEGEPFNGPRDDDSDDGMHVDQHSVGPNGTPHMAHAAHYYPRGSYGHVYAASHHPHHMPHPHHPPAPGAGPPPMVQDGYRMAGPPMPNGAPYGYGPQVGSPVGISSHGWTSQNVPPAGRNGSIYSPPTSHHARFLQSGPRISTGYVATGMQDGHPHPPPNRLAKGHAHRLSNGGELSYEEDDDDGGSIGGSHRTPQKGGNTSPDKRLPYVRWSEEEDQKLRRAISEFGQRWESVARVVGTRTYHQCRQRYLLMRRKEAAAREGADDVSS